MGWLSAWWDQIRGKPPLDPWTEDPEIVRERQHRDGTLNDATLWKNRDIWNQGVRDAWRGKPHDG